MSSQPREDSKAPRVSVILTVYKRTEFLAAAIESVLNQSYQDFEIIIADDSGIAASREIAAAYSGSGKIKYVSNPESVGIVKSLRRAASDALGDYISILNDDDLWEPDFLARTVPPLETNQSVALAFCDHWVVRNGQIDLKLSERWSAEFGRSSLPPGIVADAAPLCVEKRCVPVNIAAVFRRDAVDWSLVFPEVSGAYDFWIACLIAREHKSIYYVAERLTKYRLHAEMETLRESKDKYDNRVFIYSILDKEGWFPECKRQLRRELGEALSSAGKQKLEFNLLPDARRMLWKSFFALPKLRTLLRLISAYMPKPFRQALKKGRDRFLNMLQIENTPSHRNPFTM